VRESESESGEMMMMMMMRADRNQAEPNMEPQRLPPTQHPLSHALLTIPCPASPLPIFGASTGHMGDRDYLMIITAATHRSRTVHPIFFYAGGQGLLITTATDRSRTVHPTKDMP
jgi:hypothetical protein